MRVTEKLGEFVRRCRALFVHRDALDRELEDEMRLHRDLRARELRDEGANVQDARDAAERRFGNTLQLREEIHHAWGWSWLDQLLLDLRYGVRRLRNSPGFTAVAAITLALGIGANAAIYSFMDAILLRSLPVSDPAALVVLKWHNKLIRVKATTNPEGHGSGDGNAPTVMHSASGWTHQDPKLGHVGGIFPFPAFEIVQKDNAVFSDVFAYYPEENLNVFIKGQSEFANGEYVSGDYFHGLGVQSAAGRLIMSDDDQTGAPVVTVVSMRFSQRHFGRPADAIGQEIIVNNVPTEIIGVAPPEFFGVNPSRSPDLYFPLRANVVLDATNPFGVKPARYLNQNYYWIEVMARLRPGARLEQSQAALAPPFHQWVETTASNEAERANLPELVIQEGGAGLDNLRRHYSKPLYFLMTLVGLILTIACANVANLLLARAAARRGEMALRLSLGASRLRLVRQLLTESVLLASLGGVLGVLVAVWGIRFLGVMLASDEPDMVLPAGLNWHVLAVAAGLSLFTGVLFGLAPALQSTKADVVPALKELRASEARTGSRLNLTKVLVVSQIALSLLTLVAAGLFVRTLKNLQSVQLGFNRENMLLFRINARQAGHRDPEIGSFYEDLQKRLSVVPGIRGATLSNSPLVSDDGGTWSTKIRVAGKPVPEARFLAVGTAFFTTMQIPVLLGREVEERDQLKSMGIAVINERFAKDNFGDENPIGRSLSFGKPDVARDLEIVGVTQNALYGDLKDQIIPVVYVPYIQGDWPVEDMTFALRTAGDPMGYVDTVRKVVHQADARVPIADIRTQVEQIDQAMSDEITFAKLCTAFAVLALVIACVGLYGTMSYNVARRTSEIGIRMALGAQRGAVVWMVLREVFVLAAIGLAIGLPTALAASRLVASFLFGMKPNDPLALTLAVVTLVSAVVAAGYAPARRASRIDPMTALRHE